MTEPSAVVDLPLHAFCTALPPPAMWGRFGKAHGLIHTVARWETGGAELRGQRREAYARLLAELSAQYPEALVASVGKSLEIPP